MKTNSGQDLLAGRASQNDRETTFRAPNTLPFPSTVRDFLRSGGLTPENYQQRITEIYSDPSLSENKYPSLEVLAGWNDDPSSLYQYIDKIVQALQISGRVLLYGAGTLTGRYIGYLNQKPGIRVAGILDEKGGEIAEFQGFPVVRPAEHTRFDYDQLLILHFHWEEAMAETAQQAGVPAEKILTGITHLGLQDDLRATCLIAVERLVEQFGRRTNLILTTLAPKWSVMDLNDCDQLFPPEDTQLVVFSNPNMHYESWKHDGRPFISCPRSRPFLKLLLEGFQPENVYLKVSPHTHSDWLTHFVRSTLPQARVLVEYYDMASLFSEDFLRERLHYRDADLDLAQAATYAAATGGVDGMIVKSGGAHWQSLASSFGTAVLPLFPLIPLSVQGESREPDHPGIVQCRTEKPCFKVVYAGSVPAEEIKHGLGSFPGANMFRYLYRLVEDGDIEVDLFNAGDHAEFAVSDDSRLLRETFREGLIRYHTSIPFSQLLTIGSHYDFAFTAVHYPQDFTENVTRSGIGNRFMGYLMAGMPVIVDSYFEFQAELIARFNAGIVIEPEQLDDLPARIRAADPVEMRRGVQDLLNYMRRVNQTSFAQIRQLLERHSASQPTIIES